MGRYIGNVCRLCRAVGEKLFLKGERCFSPKCAMEKRNQPPGKKERGRSAKLSDYGIRVKEKQKLRWMFGLKERQFSRFFDMASGRKGVTGEILLALLERRLDKVVYRMGFANSMAHARQLVAHKFFYVGGRKVNIPSYLLSEGEEIEVDKNKIDRLKKSLTSEVERELPPWLTVDKEKWKGKLLRVPTREEISVPVDEKLIIELYSR